MIRAFQTIKSFGIFDDFRWPESLTEFKQFNLLYGWNYSGKTTLSRAFRCFELKKWHADFTDAKVQLRVDDGTIYSKPEAYTGPEFRVFNSDFVHDNLSFESGIASPILVLGTEDIAKQDALKAKNAERQELASKIETNKSKLEEEKSAIDRALTRYARDFIKNPLGVPSYNKTKFEPMVIKCKDDSASYMLSDDELKQGLTAYRSIEKKSDLHPIELSLSSFADLKKRTTSRLERAVAAKNPISRLQKDPSVEIWVNEGRQLHEGKRSCQFCGKPLPPDLMDHFSAHFSADYENLMAELNALATTIDIAVSEEIEPYHKSNFYPDLSERFTEEQRELDRTMTARVSALESLGQAVTAKKMQAFTSLECPSVEDPIVQIESAINAINETILAHNKRTAEFDMQRGETFASLEKHYAALFVRDERYNQRLEQIVNLGPAIEQQSKELGDLDLEISAFELALSEASKGAERVNELLAACFGKLYLRIEVSEDKRFQILREKTVAKNLSEGEETAIAFAYFITRVQDGRHPLADTIVVVDDPVSSLDANHIFNTYALIKTQLTGCRQLFILTHSFEFYNLMRDWALDSEGRGKPYSKWKKWGILLVRRRDDNNAALEKIPTELLKFKSEYHYLFSTLYHFNRAATGEFEYLLSLPNVVRRFMEAFGGIMIPLSQGLKKKMDRLFPHEVERERVLKFINYYSHNRTITRSLTIPDTSECKAVVKACLSTVENWNPVYFKDLETEVTREDDSDHG